MYTYIGWLSLLILFIFLLKLLGTTNPLAKIPGPPGLPIIGNLVQLARSQPHIRLASWAKRYGGVMLIRLWHTPVVVVSSPQGIHEVLVKQGAAFSGRPRVFKMDFASDNQSGVVFTDRCPELTGRRKLMQNYLRQYGSGIKHIEEVTNTAISDLMKTLQVT